MSQSESLSSLNASVIVCTFNRSHSLSHTLQCLAKQEVPNDVSWEVIVVDNNSKDGTRELVESMQRTWKILRYEFEPLQGLSHARNRGIACANGDVLLFTDDDVCPEPDWVVQVLAGLAKQQADACGGYIAPSWEVAPPKWLTERFYGFIAVRTDGGDAREITSMKDAPFGANMAFRRELLSRVGGFDTSRGRKGTTLASGEDSEMFERILAIGAKVAYLPESRVHHNVEAFRVTKSYFRRWRFQNSRNFAEARGVPGTRRILNIPVYLFWKVIKAALSAMIGYLTLPADEAFAREIIVWHLLGLISGSMRSRSRISSAHGT